MYDFYKPLRNRLRQYDTVSGLHAVYFFVQFLQFDRLLPPQFSHQDLRWKKPWEQGLFEWEFETFAREVLINCPDHTQKRFESWKDVAEIVNHIKRIENDVWGRQPDKGGIIHYELLRIAHRQFPWQEKTSRATIVRYLKIYRSEGLAELISHEFGMTPDELFAIGFALVGLFLRAPQITLPITNSLNDIAPKIINRFVSRFTLTLNQHREAARDSQTYDLNWAYNLNPLRLHPLIQISQETIVCPLTPLILRRLTDGIYFDLVVHRREFDRAFGPAFQSYVGEVLTAASRGDAFEVLSEVRYGTAKQPRDSIDWIVSDAAGALFIECKASRMKLSGKIDIIDLKAIQGEIERLANFVIQAYGTLSDAMNGQYPHWKPSDKAVYPVVTTLDDWQAFGVPVQENIDTKVKEVFAEKGLDQQLLQKHPYTICAISQLELAVQVMSHTGIEPFMRRKSEGEHALWTMQAFMHEHFQEELRNHAIDLFAAEFRAIGSMPGK